MQELMKTLTPMRGASYARFSDASKKHKISIDAQHDANAKFCAANHISMVAAYQDEGKTGTNINRGGFNDLVQAAFRHEFDCIIIYDITRGSRDIVDWFSFRKSMQAIGIKVYSATERLADDLLDPSAFLTEGVSVVIGQHHVLQSRQKSMECKRLRAEDGLFCGGYAPLGYRIEDGKYIIHEREAEGVRLAFEWYASGRSYLEICEQLKMMGITGRRGQFIGNNTLYFILRNERYTGKFIMYEYTMRVMRQYVGTKNNDPLVIPDAIPRIISDDLWERVQKRMDLNKKNTMNHSKKDRDYILSGLLHCAGCGGAYVGTTVTAKKHEYKIYTCGNKKRLHNCGAKNINAVPLETAVVAILRDKILNGNLIEYTADAIIEVCTKRAGQSIDDLRHELNGIETRIKNLVRSVETGLDSQDVRDRIGELSAQRKILTERLSSASPLEFISRDAIIAQLREDSAILLQSLPDYSVPPADISSSSTVLDGSAVKVVVSPTGSNSGAKTSGSSLIKSLIQKYIVGIDISDTEIVIHAVADLASSLQNVTATQKKVGTAHAFVGCTHDWLPR